MSDSDSEGGDKHLTKEVRLIRDKLKTTSQNSEEFKTLLQSLWRTKSFTGSFSGVINFKNSLKYELNIDLGEEKIRKILSAIPTYMNFVRHPKKFQTRTFAALHGSKILWQADLAELWKYNRFRFVLLCIDCFSQRIWARALKSKNQEVVEKAFSEIFKEADGPPVEIQTDQGQEFLSNRPFFRKEKIILRLKVGKNKASFAESG